MSLVRSSATRFASVITCLSSMVSMPTIGALALSVRRHRSSTMRCCSVVIALIWVMS